MSPDHRPRRMVPALGTAAAQTAHQQLNAWSAAAGQEPGSRWQMLVPSTRRYYAQRVEARGRSVDRIGLSRHLWVSVPTHQPRTHTWTELILPSLFPTLIATRWIWRFPYKLQTTLGELVRHSILNIWLCCYSCNFLTSSRPHWTSTLVVWSDIYGYNTILAMLGPPRRQPLLARVGPLTHSNPPYRKPHLFNQSDQCKNGNMAITQKGGRSALGKITA